LLEVEAELTRTLWRLYMSVEILSPYLGCCGSVEDNLKLDATMASKRRVFDSVFAKAAAPSMPTPEVASTAPGQPFGVLVAFTHDRAQAPESASRDSRVSGGNATDVRNQLKWDRSWHIITSFLVSTLSTGAVHPIDDQGYPSEGPDVMGALLDVLDPSSRLPGASETEDLLDWYMQQVRYHFLHDVRPVLVRACNAAVADTVLSTYLQILERAGRLYTYGLSFILRPQEDVKPGSYNTGIDRFRRDLNALVGNATSKSIVHSIKDVLAAKVDTVLGISSRLTDHAPTWRGTESGKARVELIALMASLQDCGLGGELLKTTFAEVMSEAMTRYIECAYSGLWSKTYSKPQSRYPHQSQSGADSFASIKSFGQSLGLHQSDDTKTSMHSHCIQDLCHWIEYEYFPLVVQVLGKIYTTETGWSHVKKWMQISVGRLGGLRTQESFDIVASWPNSNGALDDLRVAVDTPQKRLKLTDVFSARLKEQRLHPGMSTLQILRTYISMIWSFHSLDHSKVLLDRVAYPLQIYLCSREDTVKIIITGLLSDTKDAAGNPIELNGDKLVELALLMEQGAGQLEQRVDEDDWNDLGWMPDPVDAGPGYKRSKSADVIGTLIGALGTQEAFIKEFQSIVGDQLLKGDGNFDKEIRVLQLLKARFGDAPLQGCEVMIKDIVDSRRVNGVIRRNQQLEPSEEEVAVAMGDVSYASPEGVLKPSLHAKILSRLFWPQFDSEGYRVPREIQQLQQHYEQGFEALKNARKLTWLQRLGQATVELQLVDRLIVEEVATWQATVIWAFQGANDDQSPVSRTVEQLTTVLEMDETLVRSALTFWTNKMVLRETQRDVFTVLEQLNQEDFARSKAQNSAATTVSGNSNDDTAMTASDTIAPQKMQMYWQFIQGMLTNSSPQMPLMQIAMMLKMLIVDGFPYSNEELQEFLGTKIAEGQLELVKGKYKLKK
jgi:anaphase-promoting complex subunit 2